MWYADYMRSKYHSGSGPFPCSWYSYHDERTRIPLEIYVVWNDGGLKWLCYPSHCGGQRREHVLPGHLWLYPGYGQLVGIPSTKEEDIFPSLSYIWLWAVSDCYSCYIIFCHLLLQQLLNNFLMSDIELPNYSGLFKIEGNNFEIAVVLTR